MIVAKLRVRIGMSLPEIAATPFPMLNAIWEEYVSMKREEAGEPVWNPDAIPEPEDPDAPPPEGLFVAYGACLGLSPEVVKREWDRQNYFKGFPMEGHFKGDFPFGMGDAIRKSWDRGKPDATK